MSRSRRKTPVIGICGNDGSEKVYKRIRAGKERARLRELIAHERYDDAMFELAPWDEWDTARDGKHYVAGRMDDDELVILMRK
jgi:hypothetical protein